MEQVREQLPQRVRTSSGKKRPAVRSKTAAGEDDTHGHFDELEEF